jgi:hypothetical protein
MSVVCIPSSPTPLPDKERGNSEARMGLIHLRRNS